MFLPTHVVALVPAAQFIMEHLNQKKLLPRNIPGHLLVTDRDLNVLLLFHVAPQGVISHNQDALTMLNGRCRRVRDQIGRDGNIKNGITSSDVLPSLAGAVGAKQLIISYVSTSRNYLADEAIAMMFAIKAGLLPREAIWTKRCDQSKNSFNTHLLDLLNRINWTESHPTTDPIG